MKREKQPREDLKSAPTRFSSTQRIESTKRERVRCSHDESPEVVALRQGESAEFVSADEATTIAAAVQFGAAEATTAGGKATTRSAGLNKEVESVTPVPDASGATAFYVINYKGGGFMILSADKRVDPVLAVSETSTFPVNEALYPEGLAEWMDDTKAHVQSVRMKNEPLTETMTAAWEARSIQKVVRGGSGPDQPGEIYPGGGGGGGGSSNCKDYYEAVEPLLTTRWSQRNGYNAFAPIVCDNYGRAPAGCVVIAVAQVMKYHRYPHSYNWDAMPNDHASMETARLIKDVGDAVDMDYHCDHSSSDLSKTVIGFTRLGYHARKGDYDPEVIIRELKAKRPVILQGGRKQGWFGKYVDGHEWVCDGWRIIVTYTANCQQNVNRGLHMNWGWGPYSYDGWYSYHDWQPGGEDHNYKKAMVYGIMPR